MLNFKQKKTAEISFVRTPGSYRARITKVRWDDNKPEGSTYIIEYLLTDGEGKQYRYPESFRTSNKNLRTRKVEDMFVAAGYEDLAELPDAELDVELQYVQGSDGNIYLNIVEREVLSYGPHHAG